MEELSHTTKEFTTGCTFKKAKTALSIINSSNHSYYRRIILNNVFNVPSGGDYKGIYGENNYTILIKGNTFNMQVVSSGSYIYTGIYLKNNSISGGAEEEEIPPVYSLNIVYNIFNNGSSSIVLANYISGMSSYYIAHNTFNNLAEVNLLATRNNCWIPNSFSKINLKNTMIRL